ncbi:UNVERIFIED_CONTAM: UDP-glycosyltransferase 86A1 [Sesamum latifolium]|uniref:UDP-glycosyltransferase 86A1 n=1 Tax=Sesamum latifolium TaxID=2727402 RepID=A0AAW2U098_9LAMI
MAERLKLHAIIFPFPFQGHINPTINLALKLASKGFLVTFVHLESVHHTLSKSHHDKTTDEVDLFSEARQSGLDIRYATISDGFPLEYDRALHLEEYWESMLRDFPARVDEFVGKIIQSHPCLVHFLVADTLYSWPATIAEKHNLVNVSFRTETALVFSLIYHSELLRQNGHFPCKVQELESEILSALNKYHSNYAIGPVNFSENLITNSTMISKSLLPESDCTQWLDSKSPGSVLYVSFRSRVKISKQVFEEIAYGLLLSEVNFIWVVRPGIVASDDANGLPAGFGDAVQDAIRNDQPTNRKLVVDDWKIGINLCDGSSVDREEVALKIKCLMSGTISEGLN